MADTYFTEETFYILRRLAETNSMETYNSLKDEFSEEGREGSAIVNLVTSPHEKLVCQVYNRLGNHLKSALVDPKAAIDANRKGSVFNRLNQGSAAEDHYRAELYERPRSQEKRGAARLLIAVDRDGVKVAFQPMKKEALESLISAWRKRGDEMELTYPDFEYCFAKNEEGNSGSPENIDEWVCGLSDQPAGEWDTEIRLEIPKGVVLSTDADDLEKEIAAAIEALFPIYELAVEMNHEKTDSSLKEQATTATKTVKRIKDLLERKKQVILTGPPGTSKTYTAFQVIHAFSGEESPIQGDRPYQKLADYRFDPADKEEGRERDVVWDIVQFHQSYGYEDFVSGIEAESTDDQNENSPGGLKLDRVDKVFLSMCRQAEKNPATPYVLIIDEVNRGILGRIFGELILGLEYRGLPIRLQGRNGKNAGDQEADTITIPDNLYLIGTMNTADRNIALVDHALRRRFRFVDMPPNQGLLKEVLERKVENPEDRTLIMNAFRKVQELFDDDGSPSAGAIDKKNYAVGHTYFMCDDMEDFWGNMHYQVMPLLEEYVREGVLQLDDIGLLKRGEDVEGTEENVTTWLNSDEKASEVNGDDTSSEATDADDASSREKVSQQNGTLSA